MALSDRERRLLAEMEAALATDDPRLESRLGAGTLAPARPRILLGVGLTLLGIATIFGGLVAKQTLVGVIGFLVALSGVVLLIRSVGAIGSGEVRPKSDRTSLGSRLEDRWNRRNFQ
jgi:hypothetical protein